jgi:hypothetical protein
MRDQDEGEKLAAAQREHWEGKYGAHPGMYGDRPSEPARHAEIAERVSIRVHDARCPMPTTA